MVSHVELFTRHHVRRVNVKKNGLRASVERSDQLDRSLFSHIDLRRILPKIADPPHEIGLIETCIDQPVSLLFKSANWSGAQDARAVRAIEEEGREAKREVVVNTWRKVDRTLFMPVADVHGALRHTLGHLFSTEEHRAPKRGDTRV